jgi:hypothetical protein
MGNGENTAERSAPDITSKSRRVIFRWGRVVVLLLICLAGFVALGLFSSHRDPIHEGKRISTWLKELETDREGTQSHVCDVLRRAGPAAVPSLVRGMNGKDDSRLYFWLWPKLPAFMQLHFERPRQRVTFRRMCAYVLGRVEPSSRDIVEALQSALSSEDPWLVEFAAQALRMILEREPWLLSEVAPAMPQLRRLAAQPGETNFQAKRVLQTIEFLQGSNAPLLSISRDWQLRRSASSPIRYHLICKRMWWPGTSAPGSASSGDPGPAGSPKTEISALCTRTVLLDLLRNRFRIEFDNVEYDAASQKPSRIRCIEAGDGTTLRVRVLEDSLLHGSQHEGGVDFWTATGDRRSLPPAILERGYDPIFFAAGVVPARDTRIRPTALAPTNDIAAFSFGGSNIENGKRYEIVREGNKEYWIDRARDSAIVKLILQQGIQPTVTIDIDYQNTRAGWLPRKWTRNEFQNGRVRMTEEVDVTRIELEPPITAADFVLEPTAGMRVKEQRFSLDSVTGRVRTESTSYLLGRDGSRVSLGEDSSPSTR